MSNGNGVPCVRLPELPDIPAIQLMGGARLQAFADFSQGLPDDCTVTFNLMVQLAPALGSMACLLKILAALQALQGLVDGLTSVPPDFSKAGDVAKALGELAGCFASLTPVGIAITIKGALEIIIKFLNCFLDQLESIIKVQASIDLQLAEGNPVLQASLECAQENTQLSMAHLMAALGPVQPLLDMIKSLEDIVQVPLGLPSLSDISQQEDATQVISDVRQAVSTLEDVISSLPG